MGRRFAPIPVVFVSEIRKMTHDLNALLGRYPMPNSFLNPTAIELSQSTLSTGTFLGRYQILLKLGAGAMGQAYRARDWRLKRDVAIKALPFEFADDPERVARFEREATLLASLNHGNIAVIYDVV